MNFGDPLGDPHGILRGSYPKRGILLSLDTLKLGDPVRPLTTCITLKGGREQRWDAGEDAE